MHKARKTSRNLTPEGSGVRYDDSREAHMDRIRHAKRLRKGDADGVMDVIT